MYCSVYYNPFFIFFQSLSYIPIIFRALSIEANKLLEQICVHPVAKIGASVFFFQSLIFSDLKHHQSQIEGLTAEREMLKQKLHDLEFEHQRAVSSLC